MNLFSWIKRNLVLSLASVLALASIAFVPISRAYIDYLNLPVLSLLFCLMVIIGGFRECGVFSAAVTRLLLWLKNLRQLAAVLVFACFFVSMWVTNDVSLITFVPFALLTLKDVADEKEQALIIVLQTIAANLGSMCTPVGNPQNLYLYFYYGMGLWDFIMLLLPYTVASFVLLAVSLFLLPDKEIPASRRFGAKREKDNRLPVSRERIGILTGLFLLALLTVAHVVDYRITLAIVVIVTVITAPRYFRYADYNLLATFVAFFILIGNISHIDIFRQLLTGSLSGHEFWVALLGSQIISNVPAAVFLAGFTDNANALLLGTDIGGLGTLIASMASLISYNLFIKEYPEEQGYYLKMFTILNIAYLIILTLLVI